MRRAAFVGRDEQLTELGRLLDSARDGAGVVVLLDGEPGVGKTALANEVVHRARESGWTTAWGGCLEGEGAPPYWPWIQILRDLGDPADTLVAPRSSDDVSSRFRLFDEVIDVLRRVSGSGLLIVLDDLHWADTASVRLLQGVGRRGRRAPDMRAWPLPRRQWFGAVRPGRRDLGRCPRTLFSPDHPRRAGRPRDCSVGGRGARESTGSRSGPRGGATLRGQPVLRVGTVAADP
ncbi:MAG: AAA family ATPase [Pseudonocardiaceae bacterium]|nr:AAA family ATPase [Pseudonocardiaceae bacterium]